MKPLFTKILFLLAGIMMIAGSSFAAVSRGDRARDISKSILSERPMESALSLAQDNAVESSSPESSATVTTLENTPAPVKEKPASGYLSEEHRKQSTDAESASPQVRKKERTSADTERPGKISETAVSAVAKNTTYAAPVSTGTLEAASEQTGLEDLPYEDPAKREKPNFILSVFRVLVSLLVVAGCVVLSGFGLKKFMEKRSGFTFKQPLVNVLSHTYLGPRKTLYVVEVMGKVLVLGATDASIGLLTEIDPAALEKTLKDKKIEPPQPGQPQDAGFKGYLTTILERFK